VSTQPPFSPAADPSVAETSAELSTAPEERAARGTPLLARLASNRALRQLQKPSWLYAAFTVVLLVLWCLYYQRWPGQHSFHVPTGYIGGDPVAVLAAGKAFANFPAPWSITVDRLNAPFGADWNDYPRQERLLFYLCGVINRFFEPGTAGNVSLLLAHLSAGLAFAWVARRLGATWAASFVAAVLYAFSPFMLGRSLGHLLIAYIWHIPLVLYFILELDALARGSRRTRVAGYLLLVASSLQNPYYAILIFALLALASVRALLLKQRSAARFGGISLLIGLGTFLLAQMNVFLHRLEYGPNTAMTGRHLGEFLLWGLKLPDLFMPAEHPIESWARFAHTHYFAAGNAITENYFSFLGFVGCSLLVGCVVRALLTGLSGRFNDIAFEAWVVLFVVVFATAGGLNYLLASLGFAWLRASNRYSIVILCTVLLWGCRAVGELRVPLVRAGLVVLSGLIGVAEMFGMRPKDFPQRYELLARVTDADQAFGSQLESKLPHDAALFQLPVVDAPEAPPVNKMQDYEHFRPYLWTQTLRFSYGTDKGREREGWQRHVERLIPKEMVQYLSLHGFDGIVINRRGFRDNATALEGALRGLGLAVIATTEVADMVAYRIERRGSQLPLLYKSVALDEGFQGWEADEHAKWSWSSGSAKLLFLASASAGKTYEISFTVESLLPRHIDIEVGGKHVRSFNIGPGQFETIKFTTRPTSPETTIDLKTDVPAQRPPNGDPRAVAFRVINPEVTEAPTRGRSH
jgi:hypothetical protein